MYTRRVSNAGWKFVRNRWMVFAAKDAALPIAGELIAFSRPPVGFKLRPLPIGHVAPIIRYNFDVLEPEQPNSIVKRKRFVKGVVIVLHLAQSRARPAAGWRATRASQKRRTAAGMIDI
jgi:hypothetical protein